MDLQSVIAQVDSWSVEDRLQLIERIWNGLLNEGHEPNLTDELKALLDQRLEEDDSAPDDVFSSEEVRSGALRRIEA